MKIRKEKAMVKEDIEKKIARITANFALEGMHLTQEEKENCKDVLEGRRTAEEIIEKKLKGYQFDE